jgi:hypothetical protein
MIATFSESSYGRAINSWVMCRVTHLEQGVLELTTLSSPGWLFGGTLGQMRPIWLFINSVRVIQQKANRKQMKTGFAVRTWARFALETSQESPTSCFFHFSLIYIWLLSGTYYRFWRIILEIFRLKSSRNTKFSSI